MKKALAVGIVLLGLVSVSAKATEFGILLDKAIGREETLGGAGGSGLPGLRYDACNPSGFGFRAAYTFLDLKAVELGGAITYHPKAQDNITSGGTTYGKFGDQYTSIGVQADWKLLLNLHAGLDMRSEKLTTTSNSTGASDSTTLVRPWVKAGVGYALPTPVVSPFVRLEVAVPLTSSESSSSPDDFRKAMAPTLQVALYGGIRF
jgi:hypothetical protein